MDENVTTTDFLEEDQQGCQTNPKAVSALFRACSGYEAVNLSAAANTKIVATISSHQGIAGTKTTPATAATIAVKAPAPDQVIRRVMVRKSGACLYFSTTLSRGVLQSIGRPIASEPIRLSIRQRLQPTEWTSPSPHTCQIAEPAPRGSQLIQCASRHVFGVGLLRAVLLDKVFHRVRQDGIEITLGSPAKKLAGFCEEAGNSRYTALGGIVSSKKQSLGRLIPPRDKSGVMSPLYKDLGFIRSRQGTLSSIRTTTIGQPKRGTKAGASDRVARLAARCCAVGAAMQHDNDGYSIRHGPRFTASQAQCDNYQKAQPDKYQKAHREIPFNPSHCDLVLFLGRFASASPSTSCQFREPPVAHQRKVQ